MCGGAPCAQCVTFGTVDPTGTAPKGTFYINKTTGCLWVSEGAGVWIELACPGAPPAAALGDITARFDGGGSAIQSTIKPVYIQVDFPCTIDQVTMLPDQSGTIEVEIVSCSYANFDAGATHPVYPGDDITGGAPPTITATNKYQDAALAGWSKNVVANTVIGFIIPSNATNITALTVALKVTKT